MTKESQVENQAGGRRWSERVVRAVLAWLLVGLGGATAAWPAWLLAAALWPWSPGLTRADRSPSRWLPPVLGALAAGAFWGAWLDIPPRGLGLAAFLSAAALALWAGVGQARGQRDPARLALAAAVLPSLSLAAWAASRRAWALAGLALAAAGAAVLWAWAGHVFVSFARHQRPSAAAVAGLFFAATLSLGAAAGFTTRADTFANASPSQPTPHPALAATLTAVAAPHDTAPTAAPTPTPSPAPPTATPTPAPPTATPTPAPPTATPSPSPYPTFPPPPVYTGYGVVQVPPSWGQGAFVRHAPADDARVVAVVPNGTLLKVLGYRTAGVQIWLHVRPLDAAWEGWIISTALQVATPAP